MIKLLFPCKFIGITSPYGKRSRGMHYGLDLGWSSNYGGPNHEIIAPYDGEVVAVKSSVKSGGTGYGNYIQIKHNNEVNTLFAHLKYGTIKVKKGDKVKLGQIIANMGTTGNSTGVHLHYEVRINNKKENPLNYTYATDKHIISTNTKNKYKILILKEENMDNNKFEYECTKTSYYKIKLNNGEKLVIKD